VRQSWEPYSEEGAGRSQRSRGREQLLHPKGPLHLDQDLHDVRPDIPEPVRRTWRYLTLVPVPFQAGLTPDHQAQPTAHPRPRLPAYGVDVTKRSTAPRRSTARRLERVLDTPAHIYYKYEGVSPAGSHKPNTAVEQAYYSKQDRIRRLTTETGAGQWGTALAL